jgi:hypothetical protein
MADARTQIRRAQIGDAPEIARLGEQLGYPIAVAAVRERR